MSEKLSVVGNQPQPMLQAFVDNFQVSVGPRQGVADLIVLWEFGGVSPDSVLVPKLTLT